MSLSQNISELTGVGVSLASKFNRLGIHTIQDLILHFPIRYEDRTKITPIARLNPNQFAVIEGSVIRANVHLGKRRSLVIDIEDNGGAISLRFFHFNRAQQQQFAVGKKLRCIGEARFGAGGLEMYHPEYNFIASNNPQPLSQQLTAIYPTTEGISQMRLRKLIEQALSRLQRHSIALLLPMQAISTLKIDFPPLSQNTEAQNAEAQNTQSQNTETQNTADKSNANQQPLLTDIIQFLHSPPKDTDTLLISEAKHPMLQLIITEEMLAHQLNLLKLKQQQKQFKAIPMQPQTALIDSFLKQLPFAPTGAQQRCFDEICADLALPHPMQRLLQGDVGSGKTLVACLSLLVSVSNNKQVVLMAPTEILAQQHFYLLDQWLSALGITPVLLTGKMTAKQKKQSLESISSKQSLVIIGTHALVQTDVTFADVGLIIIDEQHRFGVNQRLALKNKGLSSSKGADTCFPHQLIMTATPIPRTLAMSYYGNLDCSIIDEMPPQRKKVHTTLVDTERRQQLIDRVAENCKQGVQAYWVCTLIEESEVLQSQAAEDTYKFLQDTLPNLTVGLIHGRLKNQEKSTIMQQFSDGDIDLLVATTVIEVGVDVPNASLMIIENPERLGLSQLHQLRGRVGRGERQSFCVLLYTSPLPHYAQQRLEAMRDTNDGFKIAEIDLRLRGPGELLGLKQTGDINFKLVNLQRDAHLLPAINQLAKELLVNSDEATWELIQQLTERWIPLAETVSYS